MDYASDNPQFRITVEPSKQTEGTFMVQVFDVNLPANRESPRHIFALIEGFSLAELRRLRHQVTVLLKDL